MALDKLRYQVDKLRQEVERATGVIRVPTAGGVVKFTPQDARNALLNGVDQIVSGSAPDTMNSTIAKSLEVNERRFLGINTVAGDVEDLSEQAHGEED